MYKLEFQLICSIGPYEDMRPKISCECKDKIELENTLNYFQELQIKMYKSISPKYRSLHQELLKKIENKEAEIKRLKNNNEILKENDNQHFPDKK